MSKSSSAQADEIIDKYVLWSMGAGALPIPLLDMAAITAIQLSMLKELSDAYGKEYSETFGRTLISSLAGATLAKLGASLIKAIPGIGSLLGGVPMVVLSGASTYAMGQVFKQQLQIEGVTSMFTYEYAKKVYDEAFEKGKEYVTVLQEQVGWSSEEKKTPPQSAGNTSSKDQEILEKLKMLNELKTKGILTEEEFQQKKEKLLQDLMS